MIASGLSVLLSADARDLQAKFAAAALPFSPERMRQIQPASFDKTEWIIHTPPSELAAAHVEAIRRAP